MSDHKRSTQCVHFGECGGCTYQDIPYAQQLQRKEAWVKELLDAYGLQTEYKPIRSFQKWYYRNKMEFTFSSEKGKLLCGLHKRAAKRDVFDLRECKIFSQDIPIIISAIREFCREQGYVAYDTYSHQGFLRHLIVRETKFTDELMLGIVTTGAAALATEALVERITALKLKKKLCSFFWIVNDSFGDAVVYQEKRHLFGREVVTEQLDGLKFEISIDSFFQTNAWGVKHLYRRVKEYALGNKKEKALDLYCGPGSIGLVLAQDFHRVWGVELQKAAVEAAQSNAILNEIENISFIEQDVRKFLRERTIQGAIDVVVVNPPRCGISPKVRKRVMEVNAPRIFYSSCNPKSLFEDLKEFSAKYTLRFLEPYDFFPHTRHLEVLSMLELRTAGKK